MLDRRFDAYQIITRNETDLENEVMEMERQSEWLQNIPSNSLTLSSIDGPICASEAARQHSLDEELTMETAADGTRLIISCGRDYLVRNTAWSTLCETAKLYGSALGRMNPWCLKETLNNGLQVARGSSLILVRDGKVSALHSNAAGGYAIMPISELLNISKNSLKSRFGTAQFIEGTNSHGFTSAVWELPDAQSEIISKYQQAITGAVNRQYAINFMPAVRFSSSDTASSSAFLTPCYKMNGTYFRLVDGIQVKHIKSGKEYGVELFEKEAGNIYAQFEAASEVISRLASISVFNPENAVISLCKRYNIPKKYGEAARQEIENLMFGEDFLSAHDVYLAMTNVVVEAKRCNANQRVVDNLSESVAKILKADWSEHDVGGTVSWN